MVERYELKPIGSFENPIIDSEMPPEEALRQNPDLLCPPEILERQRIIPVRYIGLHDNLYHRGQVIVEERLEEDVGLLFEEIARHRFPLGQARPVADPSIRWSDEVSMALNNTSGFNYRYVGETTDLSLHAFGMALDINPFLNPYINKKGIIQPEGAVYDLSQPGTIGPDHFIVEFLRKRGWDWGGTWEKEWGILDYHHFEKDLRH